MKLIGLTGGIGSGKSTVAEIFATLGVPVYVADHRAKLLMHENQKVKTNIIALFGKEAYTMDGQLDRKLIASKVFSNKELLHQLNAIVHPAVFDDLIQWCSEENQTKAPYLLHESAILFEENLAGQFSATILVIAPEHVRIERVMRRDGATKEEVQSRLSHQWADEKKIPLADYIIYNDGERSIIEQVRDIHQMICSLP